MNVFIFKKLNSYILQKLCIFDQCQNENLFQLKRLAELEEMVDEQDNALGTASHKYRKGLEDLKNLKLEAEENIKILKQQMNE